MSLPEPTFDERIEFLNMCLTEGRQFNILLIKHIHWLSDEEIAEELFAWFERYVHEPAHR